jgi:hypothetical protein
MDADHENDADDTTKHQQHQEPSSQANRTPPVVLTSQVHTDIIAKATEGLTERQFSVPLTPETRPELSRKKKPDFSATRSQFENNNLPYFTFYLKSQKAIKAVIHHLPASTPAEDISDVLVNPAFDVISIKQMSTTHHLQKKQPQ